MEPLHVGGNDYGQCEAPDGEFTQVSGGYYHSLFFSLFDCDGDGISDTAEIDNGTAFDVNNNGIDDDCDPDCDGNGVPDFKKFREELSTATPT